MLARRDRWVDDDGSTEVGELEVGGVRADGEKAGMLKAVRVAIHAEVPLARHTCQCSMTVKMPAHTLCASSKVRVAELTS